MFQRFQFFRTCCWRIMWKNKQTDYMHTCTMKLMSPARGLSEEVKPEGSGKQGGKFSLVKLVSPIQPAFVLFDMKTTQNSKIQCHLLILIKIKHFCCNWQQMLIYLQLILFVWAVWLTSQTFLLICQPFTSESHFLLGSSVLFCFVSLPLKEENSETATLRCILSGCCSEQLLNFLMFCHKLHTQS